MKHLCISKAADVGLLSDAVRQRLAARAVTVTHPLSLFDFGIDGGIAYGRLLSPCVVTPAVCASGLPKISDKIQLNSFKMENRVGSGRTLQRPVGSARTMHQRHTQGSSPHNHSTRTLAKNEFKTINEIRNLLAGHNKLARTGVGSSKNDDSQYTDNQKISLPSDNVYSFSLRSNDQTLQSTIDLDGLKKTLTEVCEESGVADETGSLSRPHTRRSRKKSSKSRRTAKEKMHPKKFKDVKPNDIKSGTAMSGFMIINSAMPTVPAKSSPNNKGAKTKPITISQPNTPRTSTITGNPLKSPSRSGLRSSQEEGKLNTTSPIRSKITKVYCSEKLSGSVVSDGILIPCAPPVTPTSDMLRKYEYVPSMGDVKAQRLLRIKLQAIEKNFKKKQDKILKDRAKQEEQLAKEREKMKRHRQRQEIYALNAVMTKLENDRFISYCKSKGIPVS